MDNLYEYPLGSLAVFVLHFMKVVCMGCDCTEILKLIEVGKIDTTPLITHRFPLSQIDKAYKLFEKKEDNVIKVAITPDVME